MTKLKILLIACLITFSIIFSGCGSSDSSDDSDGSVRRFVKIETEFDYVIVYDRYTKVMYYDGIHCFEPLLDSDGSLLLWEE